MEGYTEYQDNSKGDEFIKEHAEGRHIRMRADDMPQDSVETIGALGRKRDEEGAEFVKEYTEFKDTAPEFLFGEINPGGLPLETLREQLKNEKEELRHRLHHVADLGLSVYEASDKYDEIMEQIKEKDEWIVRIDDHLSMARNTYDPIEDAPQVQIDRDAFGGQVHLN